SMAPSDHITQAPFALLPRLVTYLAPPKPRFSKMRVYPLNGMISGFDGEKDHAYWIHTRVNK
ncbi:hypothetical protein, partial [Enterobacter vonholyi]|uniref:hypothetical protein n=1 Tax=Enterobacter vonholyi TaxID=2797505 RepID=UPI002A8152E1